MNCGWRVGHRECPRVLARFCGLKSRSCPTARRHRVEERRRRVARCRERPRRVGEVLLIEAAQSPCRRLRHRVEEARAPPGNAHAGWRWPAGRSRAAAPPPLRPPRRAMALRAHGGKRPRRGDGLRREVAQPPLAALRRNRVEELARQPDAAPCTMLAIACALHSGSTSTDRRRSRASTGCPPPLAAAVVAQLLPQLVPDVADHHVVHLIAPRVKEAQHRLGAAESASVRPRWWMQPAAAHAHRPSVGFLRRQVAAMAFVAHLHVPPFRNIPHALLGRVKRRRLVAPRYGHAPPLPRLLLPVAAVSDATAAGSAIWARRLSVLARRARRPAAPRLVAPAARRGTHRANAVGSAAAANRCDRRATRRAAACRRTPDPDGGADARSAREGSGRTAAPSGRGGSGRRAGGPKRTLPTS